MTKIKLLAIIAATLATVGWFSTQTAPVIAQTPTPTPVATFTVDFSGGAGDWVGIPWGIQTNPAYHTTSGPHSAACGGFGPGYWQSTEPELTNPTLGEWYNHAAIESTHRLSFDAVTVYHGGLPDSTVHFAYLFTSDNGTDWNYIGQNFSYDSCGTETISGPVVNKYVRIIYSHRYNGSNVSAAIYKLLFTNYIDHTGPEPTPTPQPCDTVQDADFQTDDETAWVRYSPSAVITNSVLSLENGDVAIQSITGLQPSTAYEAVLDVSEVISGPVDLNVSLGDVAVVLNITGPGVYATTLLTPSQTGPVQYALWNQTSTDGATIGIDYTCLTLASSGPGGIQHNCIAPTNGDFTTADGWDYLRGATWLVGQAVGLPASDHGLIISGPRFDLPPITATQYLLMTFDAISDNRGGMLGTRATAGFNDIIGYYQTYPSAYTFEADISPLAGQTEAFVAFTNAATETLVADIQIDNVCIFVSDVPPKLPYPTYPNAITPIDLGFSFTSCADIDAIWAGFGVNMAQHRANYAAGISFWDPLEWVVSAIFVTLADWSCMFMMTFSSLINALEYALNALLNVMSWFKGVIPTLVSWLHANISAIWQNVKNIVLLFTNFFDGIGNWFWQSLKNVVDGIANIIDNLAGWVWQSVKNSVGGLFNLLGLLAEWAWQSLKNAVTVYFDFLKEIMTWLWQSLSNIISGFASWLTDSVANIISWLWNVITGTLQWLYDMLLTANGLRSVINWLIAAWNALLTTIGNIISTIWDKLAYLWNEVIFPILLRYWYGTGMLFDISWDLLLAGVAMAVAVIGWLINNVFQFVKLPYSMILGFKAGLDSTAFTGLFVCNDNLWCFIFAGIELMNQAVGPSVLYPLVIVLMIICTIIIFYRQFGEFGEFVLNALREL